MLRLDVSVAQLDAKEVLRSEVAEIRHDVACRHASLPALLVGGRLFHHTDVSDARQFAFHRYLIQKECRVPDEGEAIDFRSSMVAPLQGAAVKLLPSARHHKPCLLRLYCFQ